jgi:hypothetical protein
VGVLTGATLRVLDHEPEAERGAVLDVGNATVPAILAEVSGEGTREAPAGFAGERIAGENVLRVMAANEANARR